MEIQQTRAAVAKYDEKSDSLTFSFASTAPVLRQDDDGQQWIEILSHDPDKVDFSWINSSNAPFILDHDTACAESQIGVVKRAWLDGTKSRCEIEFSSDPEKQGVINDIKKSVRSNVSVGYGVFERVLVDSTKNEIPVYECSWRPFEISSVSVPADVSVGINRTNNLINSNLRTSKMENQEIDVASIKAAAIKEATQRSFEITNLCNTFGMADRAAEFINSDKAFLDVKAEVLQEVEKRSLETVVQKAPAQVVNQAPAVHTSEKPVYDFGKAFRAAATQDWDNAGFEREMSQDFGRSAPKAWDKNVCFIDVNQRTDVVSSVGGSNLGSHLVATTYAQDRLIDVLWARTFLDKVGVDKFLGLQNNVSIPVVTSNAVSVFQGETAALGDKQGIATSAKTLSPKQMTSKFAYSRQLVLQGLPNVEAIIRDQIFQSIAQKLDQAAIANSGTTLSTTGIKNDITSNVVVAGADGTHGGYPTLDLFYKMRAQLVNGNAFDGNLAFAVSGSLHEKLHTTLKDSANTASGYILAEGQTTLTGLPLVWSQNVPNDLTKTETGLSMAILANWADFIVAQWGQISIEVDPFTAADNSQYIIRSYSFWDMAIKRASSFAIVKDFKTA